MVEEAPLKMINIISVRTLNIKISREGYTPFFFYSSVKFRVFFKISHITSTPSPARVPNVQARADHRDDVFALVLVPLLLGLGL